MVLKGKPILHGVLDILVTSPELAVPESAGQFEKPGVSLIPIKVVPKTVKPVCFHHLRLLRINLPGVHVEQVGLLLPQDFPYGTGDVGRFRRLFEYESAQTIKAVEFVES